MGTFFVDAETDGLYGNFLSVAAIVLDDTGKEIADYYGTIKNPEKYVSVPWVKDNVLPYLKDSVRSDDDYYDSEKELIEAFYSFYREYADYDVIADVPVPVEARLFIKAVENAIKEREFKAPFPLMDLSSMLYVKGYSPRVERRTIVDCSDLRLHNSFDDVRMSIRIWKKLKGEI